MALLWIDSFDTYVAHTASTTNSTPALPYATITDVVVARDSTNSFSFVQGNGGNYTTTDFRYGLPSAKSSGTLGCGAHFYISSTTTDSAGAFEFLDSGGNTKAKIYVNNGDLLLQMSGYGTGSSVSAMSLQTWFHLEAKLIFGAGTTGSLEVRLNGVLILSATGINTSAAISYIRFLRKGGSFNENLRIRDLYVWDETGSVNNDWMGEQNTYTFYPTADTATASWTLSSGTDGYALVDTPPGSSTDYITTDTVGNEVTFDFTDVPDSNIAITGVSTFVSAEKTGTEGTTIAVGLNQNYGADINLVQNTYNYGASIQEQNPTTSANWTISDINAAKLSIKRTN